MTTEPSFEIRYAHLPTGATISYEVSGDGVTVVLMPRSITAVLGLPPGQTTLARRWSQANLSRRLRLGIPDARIVAYTHLGGSMSDRAGYDFTLDGLEAELEAVVSAAVDGAFVLVAWGITSPVAISYAASHPDRVIALGLLRPWLRGSDYTSSETFRSFRPALEGDWVLGTETYAAFASGLAGHERRARAALVRDTVEQSTFLDYLDAIADHDASAVAGSVSISTFVLGFADDLFSPPSSAQEVARAIPDAQLEQLDGEDALYDRGVELVASMVEAHATAGRETVEHGLQTVLFTDLAGSTAMQSRLGDDAAREVLRAHDAAVRQAIDEFHGSEVKHTGDGLVRPDAIRRRALG